MPHEHHQQHVARLNSPRQRCEGLADILACRAAIEGGRVLGERNETGIAHTPASFDRRVHRGQGAGETRLECRVARQSSDHEDMRLLGGERERREGQHQSE